jgi:DNA-binding Lrp family transcriptional regulator
VPRFHQEIHGGNHTAIRRGQYRRVIANPDDRSPAPRELGRDGRDEPELTKVPDGHRTSSGGMWRRYGRRPPPRDPAKDCRIRRPAGGASTIALPFRIYPGGRMVQAYILVQTEVGKAAEVAVRIGEISGVTQAEDVTGPYDVIVRAEAENVDDLGRLVVAQIQAVSGITRTLTCPIVHI